MRYLFARFRAIFQSAIVTVIWQRKELLVWSLSALIATIFALSGASAEAATNGTPVPEIKSASPVPDEPLRMIISLKNQRIDVYRGRDLITSSPVSSGKTGYSTPSGVFSILQRNRRHRSNIYSNAPMPFMQRLTWSGIALHAGRVPGYPASHGCVRLPKKFATTLWSLTNLGAHVVISQEHTAPVDIAHRNLFQPKPVDAFERISASYTPIELNISDSMLQMASLEAELERQQSIEERSSAPLRILITWRTGRERLMDIQKLLNELGHEAGDVDGYFGADTARAIRSFQKSQELQANGMVTDGLLPLLYEAASNGPTLGGHIYVRQDFVDIFDTPLQITSPDEPLGTYMYSVLNFDEDTDSAEWLGLTVQADEDGMTDMYRALDRVVIPDVVRNYISSRLTPGSSLIISDNGISLETGRGTDFVVLTNKRN